MTLAWLRGWWFILLIAGEAALFTWFYLEPSVGESAAVSRLYAKAGVLVVDEEHASGWRRLDTIDPQSGARLSRQVVGRFVPPGDSNQAGALGPTTSTPVEPPGDDPVFYEVHGKNQRLVGKSGTISVGADRRFFCTRCFKHYIDTVALREPESALVVDGAGAAASLSRLTFDGRTLWTLSAAQLGGAVQSSKGDDLFCTKQGTLFVALAGGSVVAIDPALGHVKWRTKL